MQQFEASFDLVTVLRLDLRCRYGRAGGSAGHCNCSSAQVSDLAVESEHLKQAAMQASKKAANAQDFALPSIACQQVAELQPSTIRGIADQLRHLRHQAGSALQELFMRCSSVVVEGLRQFPRLGMMMMRTSHKITEGAKIYLLQN